MPRVRAALFLIVLAWMAAGPFCRQVLGLHEGLAAYMRPWAMFSGTGEGFVEARFLQRMPDGRLQEIDRFEVLGYGSRRKAPGWLRRIEARKGTDTVAKMLCKKLPEGADLRVVSRRATLQGWVPEHDGSGDFCRGVPRR